jgi:AraC-like DNA-binding protein
VRRSAETWVLLDGYRRYYQIRFLHETGKLGPLLDATAIPCYVDDKPGESDRTLRFETNERRQKLPPSLEGAKFRELMEVHNRTIAQIAAMCGLSAPSVSNYLVLTNCIPKVRSAVDRGSLPMSAGKIFSVLTDEGQQELWKKVAGVRGVTRRGLQSLAAKFPDKLFRRPRADRMKRSRHIRAAKMGQVQDRGETRSYLQETLATVADELEFKERELAKLSARQLPLMRWWASVLGDERIREYMRREHADRLRDIESILEIDAGYTGG